MKITGADRALAQYRALGEDTYNQADMDTFGKLAKAPIPSADTLPLEAGSLWCILESDWAKVTPEPGPARHSSRASTASSARRTPPTRTWRT